MVMSILVVSAYLFARALHIDIAGREKRSGDDFEGKSTTIQQAQWVWI
jgi:hypothetical protein